jgi:hypothetical protein
MVRENHASRLPVGQKVSAVFMVRQIYYYPTLGKAIPMDLVTAIDKLITEHGSASILRDHLALLRDQAKVLEKENTDLKKRVSELETLSSDLASQLHSKTKREEFIEYRGAAFRRMPDGSFDETALCPHCHKGMTSLMGQINYRCGKCSHSASFKESDLSSILAEVRKKNA